MSLILYASIPRFERKLIGLFRKPVPTLLLFAFSLVVSGSSSWAGDGDWQHAPRSRDYPANKIYRGKPAPVLLESPKAKLYRTVLRKGAKGGPNFAGHYTVIAWGCGLDSFELAVVGAMTGKVWFPPFECISLAGGFGLPSPYRSDFPNPAY